MGDKRSIGSKGLPLALLLLGAAVIMLALVATVIATTPYVGSDKCATEGCHDEVYSSWRDTFHGSDFTKFMYGTPPHEINKYTYGSGNDTTGMTGSCAVCHVVGYKDVANGGFDATKPWNDTYNVPLLGIGCEACHGAATGHPKDDKLPLSEFAYSTSCAANGESGCHGGNRQYGNETIPGWSESAHDTELPAASQRLSCANCRATEGFIAKLEGTPLTEIPADGLVWKITCMACHDPHPDEGATEHAGQLRADADVICELCHMSTSSFGAEAVHHPQTEMRKASKGYGADIDTWMDEVTCPECHMFTTGRGVTPAMQSHDWTPDAESCMICHSEWETSEAVHEWIEGEQAEIEELLEEAMVYANDIKALKAWAQANETTEGQLWTAALNTSYYEALWDITMVEADKSLGMHNPDFTEGLLEAGMMRAGSIKDALNVGGVSGKVEYSTTPAEPIPNATIKDGSGNVVATTGADGSYFFWAPAMNRLYVIELGGKPIGTLTASGTAQTNKTVGTSSIDKVVPPTTNGDDGDDEPMLNTLSIVLIVVIVVLILLLLVMSMKKKPAA